jgi:DNA gyrase subunit B
MRSSSHRIDGFADCLRHAPSAAAELFIVEGDSAADAVIAVRDAALQAVLALQGKPMNALRASPGRLGRSPWLAGLVSVLGSAPGTALPLGELRYERIVILMDPDADGIHAGALLQIFFLRTMRPLLEAGTVQIVHAPWSEIRGRSGDVQLAWHERQFQQQVQALGDAGLAGSSIVRHRGLGSLSPALLARTCIDPTTRRATTLGVGDAEDAARVFG